MNKLTLSQKLIPLITIIFIYLVLLGPLSVPYLGMIISALLILIASYIEYKGKWLSSLGFQRANFTAKNMLLYAPLVALGLFALYLFIIVPVVTSLTGNELDFSDFKSLEGDWKTCLLALPYIWLSAAFGEEIVLRGYLMKQFVKFFGDGKLSIIINIILFACFFGYLHSYQGFSGQLVTGIIGALLAIIFYLKKYDLWFVVAVHGFFDTIAVFCMYNGFI